MKLVIHLILVTVLSCVSSAADLPTGADAEFVARFRSAYSAKDVDSALRLICWDGASAKSEGEWRPIVAALFDHTITDIRVAYPTDDEAPAQFTHPDGTIYKPNLDVIRTVEFQFGPKDGVTPNDLAWGWRLGLRDGRLQVVNNVPAK